MLYSRKYQTLNTVAEIREYLDAYEDLYPVVCQTREYGHKLRVEFCWIKSDVMSKAELRSSVQLGFFTVSAHLLGGFLMKLVLWKALKDDSKVQHNEDEYIWIPWRTSFTWKLRPDLLVAYRQRKCGLLS